jgi:hypothetical protein
LGKTITLPGSWESLNLVGRTWANAGAARTSADASSMASRTPFILTFIVDSFSLRPSAGASATQTVCHVPPQKLLLFLNMLDKNAARLVRKAGLGPTAQSGLPDWINAGLEAGLPRFRERHQKPTLLSG